MLYMILYHKHMYVYFAGDSDDGSMAVSEEEDLETDDNDSWTEGECRMAGDIRDHIDDDDDQSDLSDAQSIIDDEVVGVLNERVCHGCFVMCVN